MTLRTLAVQEARFSLVFFDVDRIVSVVETRKLQAVIPGSRKVIGTRVQVKDGKETYEAEIRDQSNDKKVMNEKLNEVDACVEDEASTTSSDNAQPQPIPNSKRDKQAKKRKDTQNPKQNKKPRKQKEVSLSCITTVI